MREGERKHRPEPEQRVGESSEDERERERDRARLQPDPEARDTVEVGVTFEAGDHHVAEEVPGGEQQQVEAPRRQSERAHVHVPQDHQPLGGGLHGEQGVGAVGLHQPRRRQQPRHRPLQRFAEQGMVVGHQNGRGGRGHVSALAVR